VSTAFGIWRAGTDAPFATAMAELTVRTPIACVLCVAVTTKGVSQRASDSSAATSPS
jgi:hypothetical protein